MESTENEYVCSEKHHVWFLSSDYRIKIKEFAGDIVYSQCSLMCHNALKLLQLQRTVVAPVIAVLKSTEDFYQPQNLIYQLKTVSHESVSALGVNA